MSAGISKVHGQVAAGAFYGYQPLVIKVENTGAFIADTVDSVTGAITVNGYTKAVQVLETFASIIWLGAQDDRYFTAIVDNATVNQGDGTGGQSGATTGFGALKSALALANGETASDYIVTTSTALNGAGTFTFA